VVVVVVVVVVDKDEAKDIEDLGCRRNSGGQDKCHREDAVEEQGTRDPRVPECSSKCRAQREKLLRSFI
jgi:hypothetical protein